MPMAPAAVLNGPRGDAGMSIQRSLSQPCTRAHSGSVVAAAASATTTVNGAYQRVVLRLRVSEAMVSSTSRRPAG